MMVFWDSSLIATFLVFVLTYVLVFKAIRKPTGIPPGPALLPVIGNLLSFSGDLIGNLEKLRLRFGDIYSLYLGNQIIVFLNGYNIIHDALIKKGSIFSRRPNNAFFRLVLKDRAIIFSNGKLWKDQRKFATAALNELCFKNGGGYLEEMVTKEIDYLTTKLGELKKPADIGLYIRISFSNVIYYTVYRHRFDFDDGRVERLLSLVRDGTNEFAQTQTLVNCFPFLSKLPFDILGIKRTLSRTSNILEIQRPFVNRVKSNHIHGKRDSLVGLYLNFMEELGQKDERDTFTEEQMEVTMHDLIIAGIETSATTVCWLLIYLMRYQHIQEKLFDEISSILGKESPCLAHRERLPYTQAVILEVLRISTVAPLAVPHSVVKDTMFHGYLLPKDCVVMVNIHSANNDPRAWKNPDEFRPERFLSNDESDLDIPKQFIPFSLGHRSCPGETLAKAELFLCVAMLMQKFKFLPANDGEMPSLQGQLGLTRSPKPYNVKVLKRDLL